MENLPLTSLTLTDVESHLAAVKGVAEMDTAAIEAYLARHLVLILCAEVEQAVTALVYDRVDRGGCDSVVANLMSARKRGMVRSAKHEEIASTLAQLSDEIREKYEKAVMTTIGEAGVNRLGNTVGARDRLSHTSNPPDIGLGDVREALSAASSVVDAVRAALV